MFLSVFDKCTFSREQKVCKWNIAAARQIGDLDIIGIFICSSYELPKICCWDLWIYLWTLHMKWGKSSKNSQKNSYYLYLCLFVLIVRWKRDRFFVIDRVAKTRPFLQFFGWQLSCQTLSCCCNYWPPADVEMHNRHFFKPSFYK